MKSTTNPTPNMRTCAHCGVAYDWRRSTSRSLKMTYCNSLCEAADLGFTIEALLSWQADHAPAVGDGAVGASVAGREIGHRSAAAA